MLATQKTMTGEPKTVTSLLQLLPKWMRGQPARRPRVVSERESEEGFRLIELAFSQKQREAGR